MPRYDVAFLAPYIGPLLAGTGSTGGGETQMLLLATELAARGRRVAVAAVAGEQPLPASFRGVDVVAIPRRRGGRLRSAVSLTSALLRDLDAEVLVQRAAGPVTGLVAVAAKVRRRRFVYSSASVVDFDYGRLEGSRLMVAAFHLGLRLADTVVVQSEEQRALLGRPCEVVYSLAEPAPLRGDAPDALLWVGRFAPYKRPHALLDAAEAVPEARFRVVGAPWAPDPHLGEAIRRRAAGLPNVELLPSRPRDELLELMGRAAAVVSTSDFEGMPNVFLEGWARGVPALALRHDPDATIATHRVGWFAGGDAERFAAQVREAWSTRGDQRELSARCRELAARRHGIGTVVDAWERALWGSAAEQQPAQEAR